jgi:hypothetical protein
MSTNLKNQQATNYFDQIISSLTNFLNFKIIGGGGGGYTPSCSSNVPDTVYYLVAIYLALNLLALNF